MYIKSHLEVFGTDFPRGGEWDAGVIHRADLAGRWTMRCREEDGTFLVFFYNYMLGKEKILAPPFPATEEGEVSAKLHARECLKRGVM